MHYKLTLAVFALCCMAAASAIKCHVCSYSKNGDVKEGEDCADSYDAPSKYSQSCGSDTNYCMKTKGSQDDKEYVARACGLGCTKTGDTESTQDGVALTVSCCEGDDCNAAMTLLPTLTLLLAPVAITWLF